LTKFFSEHFGDRPLDVADMGGGSCFLAVELALSGHRLEVFEKN
jgi:hypothetical protein